MKYGRLAQKRLLKSLMTFITLWRPVSTQISDKKDGKLVTFSLSSRIASIHHLRKNSISWKNLNNCCWKKILLCTILIYSPSFGVSWVKFRANVAFSHNLKKNIMKSVGHVGFSPLFAVFFASIRKILSIQVHFTNKNVRDRSEKWGNYVFCQQKSSIRKKLLSFAALFCSHFGPRAKNDTFSRLSAV